MEILNIVCFRGSDGFLENVHFNLHFTTDAKTRLFATEIKEMLGAALNSSQVIPEVELESLTVTERKLEHPNRKKIVIGGGHKRQKSGHGGQHDTSLYNGGLMWRKTKHHFVTF